MVGHGNCRFDRFFKGGQPKDWGAVGAGYLQRKLKNVVKNCMLIRFLKFRFLVITLQNRHGLS